MFKPFLHERTQQKIDVFDHDVAQWKAAILLAVEPQQLPVSYGGTLTDPDGNPDCVSMVIFDKNGPFKLLKWMNKVQVGMGGDVPSSYYFNGNLDTTNKIALRIPSGSKERLTVHVDKPGAILR